MTQNYKMVKVSKISMKKSRFLTLEMRVIILDKQIKVFLLSIERNRRTSIIFSFKVRQKKLKFLEKESTGVWR